MKFYSWLLSALFFFSPLLSAAAQPTDQVRETVDAVLMVLKDEAKDVEVKKDEIRSILAQRFDYRAMSQRTLARNWRTASKAEQDRFTELYGRLLEDTYLVMVEEYTNEEVAYKNETIKKEKYGEVETAIMMADKEIPVVYKTIRRDDGNWYIYDVVIEGVSLISNYRSSYGAIAKKEGVSGLINKLEAKLNGA
jgi:phospholipid transport system substrate-binding protein